MRASDKGPGRKLPGNPKDMTGFIGLEEKYELANNLGCSSHHIIFLFGSQNCF
jgi:hypothetical protein